MIYVKPQELQEVWNLVKEGLEKINNKISDNWIPEDVYYSIKSGESSLYLFYDNDNYEGFTVLTINQSYNYPILFIWCFYSNSFTNAPTKYWPEIQEVAHNIGAKKIQFNSPRKGWEKMFKKISIIYEGEV